MTERPDSARASEWDRHATQWIADRPQQLWRRHSDAVNIALIEQWLPAGPMGRILKTDLFDEAVSDGICGAIADLARVVVGLDVSQAILVAASRRNRDIHVAGTDVRCLPFESASFDAIVSISTLDHFDSTEDVRTALSELFRVLVPGGVLVLTLDNLANPVVGLRNSLPYRVTHRLGLVPYPVGRTFRPDIAEDLVRQTGFEVTDRSAVMHAPRVLAIPVMNLLSPKADGPFLRLLSRMAMSFERLRPLRTKFLTGHFVAIRAAKPVG